MGSLVKSLLYSKHLETKEIRWGKTHEVDAKSAYISYLRDQGHHNDEVTDSGLVLDVEEPCLGCSPDALVNIPASRVPLGIAEFKCPYTAQSQTPAEAAASNSKFSCSLSSSGELKATTTTIRSREPLLLPNGAGVTLSYGLREERGWIA